MCCILRDGSFPRLASVCVSHSFSTTSATRRSSSIRSSHSDRSYVARTHDLPSAASQSAACGVLTVLSPLSLLVSPCPGIRIHRSSRPAPPNLLAFLYRVHRRVDALGQCRTRTGGAGLPSPLSAQVSGDRRDATRHGRACDAGRGVHMTMLRASSYMAARLSGIPQRFAARPSACACALAVSPPFLTCSRPLRRPAACEGQAAAAARANQSGDDQPTRHRRANGAKRHDTRREGEHIRDASHARRGHAQQALAARRSSGLESS